ncbi:MAG: CRISPR-associated endonuclease Cas1, partial [Chloroflexota bacterium]
ADYLSGAVVAVVNPRQSLEIARAVIVGKINNQRVVLQRRAQEDRNAAKALKGMLNMLKKVQSAKDIDQLRGFEGKAAAHYFKGVRTFFPAKWEFTKREYYPPPDAANALLSYCYTLLLKDVKASIHIVGLDPALGFFHVLGDNRPSLALDLMEEFRPSISDIVVLTLVLEGSITLADFEYTAEAGLPIRLTQAGREVLITAYEQRLAQPIFHPMAQGETSLRNAIRYQARQMRWIVEGKADAFETIQLQ